MSGTRLSYLLQLCLIYKRLKRVVAFFSASFLGSAQQQTGEGSSSSGTLNCGISVEEITTWMKNVTF